MEIEVLYRMKKYRSFYPFLARRLRPLRWEMNCACYLLDSQNLLDKLELDVDEIVNMKMTQNEAKYPVDKAKGGSDKYDKL